VEIRAVRPDEHDRLGAITLEAYTSLPGSVLEPDYELELADIATRASAAAVLVAVEDDRILGGLTYVPDADNPMAEHSVPHAASIRMLAVDRAERGRGVAEALMRHCLERAVHEGAAEVVLHSTPWMEAAHRLYARLGFRRDPSLDWDAGGVELWGFRRSVAG